MAMTTLGRAARSPVLVPFYALVAAFLFVLVVGLLAGPVASDSPGDPQVAPTPAPAESAAPFRAANGGMPTFRVVAEGSPTPVIFRSVLKRADGAPGGYRQVGRPLEIALGAPQELEKPLVDRLLCVTARTPGWSIALPPGVADLAPPQWAAKHTVCQGGWSDPRAVPAELSFVAKKGA